MKRGDLPPLTDDLAPKKKVDFSALRIVAKDDAAIEENSRALGKSWGAQTRLADPSPAAHAAPRASLRIEVPDYLDRALAFKAVELRTTKQFLVIKALADAGFAVEPADLVEDRRRKKRAGGR